MTNNDTEKKIHTQDFSEANEISFPVSAHNSHKRAFTSFSRHRPAQRDWARTGLIGPMQGAIPTQSHNPQRLDTPLGSMSTTLFEQWCGFFYAPQEQISESAVRLIQED